MHAHPTQSQTECGWPPCDGQGLNSIQSLPPTTNACYQGHPACHNKPVRKHQGAKIYSLPHHTPANPLLSPNSLKLLLLQKLKKDTLEKSPYSGSLFWTKILSYNIMWGRQATSALRVLSRVSRPCVPASATFGGGAASGQQNDSIGFSLVVWLCAWMWMCMPLPLWLHCLLHAQYAHYSKHMHACECVSGDAGAAVRTMLASGLAVRWVLASGLTSEHGCHRTTCCAATRTCSCIYIYLAHTAYTHVPVPAFVFAVLVMWGE